MTMKRMLLFLSALCLLFGCRQDTSAAADAPGDTPSPWREAVAYGTPASPAAAPKATPDRDRPMVALTFDDGPTKYTSEVLDLLERYGAKGTFFVIGSKLNKGTRPILQRMADMGCDIGMHDLTHTDLTKLSASANARRIERMRALIHAQIEGGYHARLLRPPFGALNKAVRQACAAEQVICVRWSVDTRDWSNKNPRTIVKIVQKETRDGAILLFHDRLPTTVTALRTVIPYLQDQGYALVTVTELLESGGQPLSYGEDYRRKPGP